MTKVVNQEKERAVKWIETKKEEVVNAVKKIDAAQVISGMSDMAAGIGSIAVGVGALLVPGVGIAAGAIALGTIVCGAGLTITGFGDVHQGFTGVDPVRNIAKSLGMSDSSYDTMKGGFMVGSFAGSIYSGNVVRMFGKAGSTLGMAAGSEAAGTTGKAVVSAEEETAVVQRASTSVSEKTFVLPGDSRITTLKGVSNPSYENVGPYSTSKWTEYFNSKYGKENVSLKGTDPADFLNSALRRQGLDTAPVRLKETWIQDGYKYTVRIHPAEAQYGKTGSIYRVSRQNVEMSTGLEYMGTDKNWYHTSVLKPGRNGNVNSNFNNEAAEMTHIQLP